MSLSVQRSVVELFKFNGKNMRAFYIRGVGQCLYKDKYTAVGYKKENGVNTMQRLVPEKYKMRLGDAVIDMKEVDKNIHLHPDTVLLKEPGCYSFLSRCKRDKAKPLKQFRAGSRNSFTTSGSKFGVGSRNSFTTSGSKISLSHRRKRYSNCIGQ